MVWMRALGVQQWNYLVLEGGFGDYGYTYSLIQSASQPDDEVKPAALSAMTASAQLAGRSFQAMVSTDIPHTYAARFGPRAGGSDNLYVAWTDDFSVNAALSAPGSTGAVKVTSTDLLGRVTTLKVGSSTTVGLSGSPVYLSAPAANTLRFAAAQAYGSDVARSSAGAVASASSATASNAAAKAIDGVSGAAGGGDLGSIPAWASAPGDDAPSLTVRFAGAKTIRRIVVATHSLGSIVPGARTYSVDLEQNGTWTTVQQVTDQFFGHIVQISFSARAVTAVRVRVATVDYTGVVGGLKPWFWPTDAASLSNASAPWYAPAVVEELEAY